MPDPVPSSPTPLALALDHVGTTVVNRLRPSDLGRPTPCPGWDVRQLLNHVIATTTKFSAFARLETDTPHGPPGDLVGAAFQPAYWEAARASTAAWALPGPGRPVCHLPFGDFPAAVAADINLFDVLVHGWDLATAVELDYPAPTTLVVRALAVAERLVSPAAVAAGQYGHPGAEGVAATPMGRLLELTGRRPPHPS
jgi:uncharacterized protein (TIGR03086 family)